MAQASREIRFKPVSKQIIMLVLPFAIGLCEGFRHPKEPLNWTYALNSAAVIIQVGKAYMFGLKYTTTVHGQKVITPHTRFLPGVKLLLPMFLLSNVGVWSTWWFSTFIGRAANFLHNGSKA